MSLEKRIERLESVMGLVDADVEAMARLADYPNITPEELSRGMIAAVNRYGLEHLVAESWKVEDEFSKQPKEKSHE